MRQHYLRGLPFLASKIYHFEVRLRAAYFLFFTKKSAFFIVIYDKFTYNLLYTFNENQHKIRFMLKAISKLW